MSDEQVAVLQQRVQALEGWRDELMDALARRDEKQDHVTEKLFQKLDALGESISPIKDWMNTTKGWKSGVIFLGIVVSGFLGWLITTILTWRHS